MTDDELRRAVALSIGEHERLQQPRPISQIIHDVREDMLAQLEGKPSKFTAAWPYVEALRGLNLPEDDYYADNARSLIRYFLANAGSWRGPNARRLKQELRDLVDAPPADRSIGDAE